MYMVISFEMVWKCTRSDLRGSKFKIFWGVCPQTPLRLHYRTQSLCPPPQNLLFCPCPSHPFENLCSIVHTPCLVHTNWHFQVHFLSFLPFLLLFSHLLLPSFSLYLLPLTYLLSPSSPYLIPPLLSSSPPPISPSLTLPPPPSLPPSLLSRMSQYLMKMFTHLCSREGMKGEEEEEKKSRRNQTMLYLLMLGR